MNSVDALIDIAKTFMPMQDEAVVAINCGPDGVYAQAIRENYEAWKFFYANETGDDGMLIDSFGYGNLHQPLPDLQGDYILWNPSTLTGFNKNLPLAKKEITFDTKYKVWIASFRDGDALAETSLGSNMKKLDTVIPRFKHFFPKLAWTVDGIAVKQLKAMYRQEIANGIENFWLFTTKSKQICASFDRQPKSDATKRVTLAYGVSSEYLVPYTFPAKRFIALLELMENGSVVTVELADESCIYIKVCTKFGDYTFVLLGSADLIHHWHMDHLLPPSPPIDRRGYGESCMYGDWDPDLKPPR